MNMKIRRYEIVEGATISKNGEFLHINDVVLLLKEALETVEDMIAYNKDSNSEYGERCVFAYKKQKEMLNALLDTIKNK